MKDTCNLAEFRGFRKIRQVVGVVTLFLALTLAGPLASLAAAPPTSVYLVSFDLNKTTLVRNGNDSITGTVTVGGVPAGYGWPVYLSSANGFVLMPSPGTGVTGNGNATVTSAPFSISPYVFGGTSPVTETITATVSGGNSISKAITINPIFPTLTLSPGTLTDGLGQTVTATLSTGVQVYDGAGTYSISTSSGAVSVPSPVTIPDGENSFQFQLSQGTAVSTATPVTVTATQHWPIYGANSASAAIMVRPAGGSARVPSAAITELDCPRPAPLPAPPAILGIAAPSQRACGLVTSNRGTANFGSSPMSGGLLWDHPATWACELSGRLAICPHPSRARGLPSRGTVGRQWPPSFLPPPPASRLFTFGRRLTPLRGGARRALPPISSVR